MAKAVGCPIGEINRNMIETTKEEMRIGFKRIDETLLKIDETQRQLFNHLSSRFPKGAAIALTVMGGIVGVLLGVCGTFAVTMIKTGGVA